MCKDRAGTGLLHKAVFRGQRGVVDWLLDNQPNTVHLKDREGRTPLHYCGACEDQDAMWQRLVDAGADVGAKDNRGRTADYYLEKPDELRLPTSPQHPAESRGRAADTGLVVKPANIRIWIHDRDMGKLQQLLWEGHGARLRNETSKYPIVKRFLEGVPFVMGAVKDVHTAAIAGDLETFQKRTEEPVPREIFTSKDANGLTPLHKAAGLGHGHIVDDILARAPGAVSVCDAERRTALHFAALVRDGGEVYNKLVRAGADELAQDNMGRTPEHYKSKPADLDAGLLRVVPDAPRTSAAYPPNWDWSVITDPAARVFNGRRSYENGDSESASSRDNEDVVAPTQRAGEDGQGAVGEGGDGDGDSEASPQPAGDASGGQEGASLRDGDADAAENDESAEGGDPPGPPQNDVDGDVGEEESSEQPEQGDADDEVGADEVAPTDSVPTEGAPSGAAPSGDAPAEDASNEEAPPEGAPDQNAATEVSANEIPVADASTGDIPDDEARTEEASTVEASTPAEVSEDRCTTEDGDGQDAEAEDGGVEVGGAEDGEVEDGEVEDGDAGASNAEGGDAQGSDAEGGDAEGGDVEGGDAGGGDAEGGDAEGGDAEGGDAGGDAGGSGGEDGIGNEDGVGDGGVQEVSGGGDSVKGDGIEQDGIEQDGIEQDGTEAGADEEGRIEGDGVEGEVSEENKEAEEMDDDQKDVISKPEQKSQTEDGDGAKEEEEEKTEEGEDRDAKLQKDDEKDRDNDDADQGGANANEGTGLDEEGERQADNEEGGGDAQPDGENSEDKGEGRGQEEVNEELTQADSGQEQVEDAVGQDAPAERDSGDGVDSREQESADAPEASGEEEGEDVVVGDTSDAQGGARDRDSTSTKEKEQRELAPAPEDSGTNQSAATTVALDGTDLEPEPPPPPEPEPEPVPRDKAEEGRGDVRARPPTPRPQATLLGNDGGDEDEDEEDEGVGEDDDERYPRDPGQMTDDELDAHISRGDLGVLADLVLNGEGDRLLNKNSSNPEVQSFLDHVPSYMAKIRAVHDAARAGNLRGLQAALDRRKFAVARDRRSQSACTPLHLAVLLGQTAVVRYLSGRFPETLSARDLRGRTALHYAAVLADNAHYYNLLLNLGANRALKDKRGATADFYLQNPNTLTHRQLLADIGEPESIADEMFSDKVDNDKVSSRRDVHAADTMALMDRCFRLLHEGVEQREDAPTGAEGMPPRLVVAYRDLREVPEAPADRARGDRPAVLRFLPRHVFDQCKRTLTRMDHSIIDVLWPAILDQQDQHRDPVAPNGNPYASRTRDSYMDEAGFVAPDLESYAVFGAVMLPVIKWLNGLDIRAPLRDHPPSQFYEEPAGMRATQSVDEVGEGGGLAKHANGTAPTPLPPPPSSQSAIFRLRSDNHLSRSLDIDPGGRVVLRSVVQVARNLTDVRLPLDLTEAQLAEVEDAFRRALLKMDGQHQGPVCVRETPRRLSLSLVANGSPAQNGVYRGAGEYFSFPDIPPSAKERLRRARLWPYVPREREGDEDRLRRLHGRTWPAGRGVFVSGDASLASLVAWINVHDHVRVMAASADGRGGQIGDVYRRAADCVLGLQRAGCHFARDPKLGFLLARPWDVGCGLRFQATTRLPKLGREPDQLASLCRSRGLRLRRTLHPEVFLIANKQVLGVSEHQAYRDYVTAMSNIIQLESRVESNSFRLGAVLSRVFRKRPSA
ncbi:uncharacterized protein LOC113205649 isoform X4 [Frankliniella occidentalis]|uniref:Uncharacterized protein LOC113205649 isoform X4 n=1 Tax=Frankliniella occidentalis TaxID=133901 RepID=A0A9C6WXI6_FRAOC|nr:uncharacterized protein LOC113205649 isoform X4 [Frankliniella occidentalis]